MNSALDEFKVTLIMVMSANGKVARKTVHNSFEWNSNEDQRQFLKRIRGIGTALMGSNTYRSIDQTPYEGVTLYVLSHHPDRLREHPAVHLVQGRVIDICRDIRDQGISHLALLGGPDVNAQFFNYDLVDEIFLTVEPLLLDGGLNLVGELEESVSLALNEVSLLGNGSSVLFHYVVEK